MINVIRVSVGLLALAHNTKVGIRFNGAYRLLSAVLIAEFINL